MDDLEIAHIRLKDEYQKFCNDNESCIFCKYCKYDNCFVTWLIDNYIEGVIQFGRIFKLATLYWNSVYRLYIRFFILSLRYISFHGCRSIRIICTWILTDDLLYMDSVAISSGRYNEIIWIIKDVIKYLMNYMKHYIDMRQK